MTDIDKQELSERINKADGGHIGEVAPEMFFNETKGGFLHTVQEHQLPFSFKQMFVLWATHGISDVQVTDAQRPVMRMLAHKCGTVWNLN